MTDFDPRQTAAIDWFRDLRDRICAEFEAIERSAGSDAGFVRKRWQRTDHSGAPGGGGTMAMMKGRVFEKVGVNISTVHGAFDPEFAKTIPGAANDPRFFATGISLVAHMTSPKVPAVHMNTRYLVTTKAWFGGGADLNPPIPDDTDTAAWLAAWRACCDRHDPAYFPKFKAWCDDYFFIRHRGVARGVGGIFYDQLDSGDWDGDFAFTRDVGETFLAAYPPLVRRHMDDDWNDADRARQLEYRGRYAEFNLVYDRGTLFGLKTGGNIEAILMSLPPVASWS
jgi:coproporphyrinogen III oxidase